MPTCRGNFIFGALKKHMVTISRRTMVLTESNKVLQWTDDELALLLRATPPSCKTKILTEKLDRKVLLLGSSSGLQLFAQTWLPAAAVRMPRLKKKKKNFVCICTRYVGVFSTLESVLALLSFCSFVRHSRVNGRNKRFVFSPENTVDLRPHLHDSKSIYKIILWSLYKQEIPFSSSWQ